MRISDGSSDVCSSDLVILPGEMKEILNRVVEAEKVAQANLIKRREETAATRALLNTARLMDENPTLLRLKELETLAKVTEKVDKQIGRGACRERVGQDGEVSVVDG